MNVTYINSQPCRCAVQNDGAVTEIYGRSFDRRHLLRYLRLLTEDDCAVLLQNVFSVSFELIHTSDSPSRQRRYGGSLMPVPVTQGVVAGLPSAAASLHRASDA